MTPSRSKKTARCGVSAYQRSQSPSSLEDRCHVQVESWQQITRECVLVDDLPDFFYPGGSELVDLNGAGFRIDNPKFFDSGTCVLLLLVYQIQAASLWRKNLNHKLRRTLRSFLGQNLKPFVQNNNYIRLKDVEFIQINIKWSVEEFPDRVALQITMQFKLQVTGNLLMKTVRRRSHIKIALDQLIPRPGLR